MAALNGQCGAAVAIDIRTGAVLVMATRPTYDPNLVESNFGRITTRARSSPCTPTSPLVNRATDGLFVPGSSFKVVTATAALDSGRYTPDSRFVDRGYCIEYGKQVQNFGDQNGPEVFGPVDFLQALEHSINAVFCDVGKSIGARSILNASKRYGFYKDPPLETPDNERAPSGLYKNGRLFDPTQPQFQVDPGRLAFGQERMLVTPLQMAMVASGVANHGVVMRPFVVGRVTAPDGTVISRTKPRKYRRAMKTTTADDAERDDAGGRDRRNRHRRADPGRPRRGQDGDRGDRRAGTPNTTWFISFAPANARATRSRSSSRTRPAPAGRPPRRSRRRSCRRYWPEGRTPNLNEMAVTDTLIGTVFDGRYLIVRKLGAGGMADVYLAEDQELGRRVAIKILNDRHAADEQFVERFRREAKNAAGLSHPNIVQIYDRGDRRGHLLHRDGVPRRALAQGADRRPRARADQARDRVHAARSSPRSASRTGTGSSTATSSRTTCSAGPRAA